MRYRGLLIVLAAALVAGCFQPSPGPRNGPSETEPGSQNPSNRPPPSDPPGPPGSGPVPAGNHTDGRPPYRAMPADVKHLEPVAQAPAAGGYRVFLWDDRAYLATVTSTDGLVIYDIHDPEAPVEVGKIPGLTARVADALPYGNRTLIATANGGPLVVYDVTNLDEIREVAHFDVTSHNVAVHRPGFAIYNSRSLAEPPGVVEIYDARDPDHIRLHKEWTMGPTAQDGTPILVPGCHEITVYPHWGLAFCAAITQTLVWNVLDPLNPSVITAIENPAITAHHTALGIGVPHGVDNWTLLINDEFAAGFGYGCFGTSGQAAGDAAAPSGGIWFYDPRTIPYKPLSYFAPPSPAQPDPARPCFSHTGTDLGEGSRQVVWGWIQSGLVLLDARDPTDPRLIEQTLGANAWDARYYRGYVFTAEETGGLGVWRPE